MVNVGGDIMEICDVHKSCALFNNELIDMKTTAKIMKSKYCFTNFSRCLCYEHSQDRLIVSSVVFFPNQEIHPSS